jgi:RNA polymerase sigma-70 factor (ECF subfamily)
MGETLDIDALYAASYRRLVVQLYALCGDLGDAEDAVQEAFVAAIRKQRALDAVDNPEAWLRTVALNRIRGGWRHALVVRRYEVKVPGPQAGVEVGPEHVAIIRALADLDDQQRHVVVLHHLADLSVGQVAAELGVPTGTVKSRLSRARTRMAGLLDERADDRDSDREEPRHA